MRIMPVTNQNNTRTQTSFKRFLKVERSFVVNEKDIVSVEGNDNKYGRISYIVYNEATSSDGKKYVYPMIKTNIYNCLPPEDFFAIFKQALDNFDDSISKRSIYSGNNPSPPSKILLYNNSISQKP